MLNYCKLLALKIDTPIKHIVVTERVIGERAQSGAYAACGIWGACNGPRAVKYARFF